MIYVTGETNGSFMKIYNLCKKNKTTKEDTVVILGNSGLNYYEKGSHMHKSLLNFAKELPITIFCIRGDCERNPANNEDYSEVAIPSFKNYAYRNRFADNVYYAVDDEIYNFGDKKVLVFGGGVPYNLRQRKKVKLPIFPNCEITPRQREDILSTKKILKNKVDIVLSYTCPLRLLPTLNSDLYYGIDQYVDLSTEDFLDEVENGLNYKQWICSHWGIDEKLNAKPNSEFIFLKNEILKFE